mmetsp:Transcript_30062/g.82559  ORF Transcript_30062/g.82559 Transcript_30062/m.82559 type:complete len:276 (+) Transcript_30062:760-1587(+)
MSAPSSSTAFLASVSAVAANATEPAFTEFSPLRRGSFGDEFPSHCSRPPFGGITLMAGVSKASTLSTFPADFSQAGGVSGSPMGPPGCQCGNRGRGMVATDRFLASSLGNGWTGRLAAPGDDSFFGESGGSCSDFSASRGEGVTSPECACVHVQSCCGVVGITGPRASGLTRSESAATPSPPNTDRSLTCGRGDGRGPCGGFGAMGASGAGSELSRCETAAVALGSLKCATSSVMKSIYAASNTPSGGRQFCSHGITIPRGGACAKQTPGKRGPL